MNTLGVACEQGSSGVAKDEAKAVDWYTRSAHTGDVAGMTNLAHAYELGTGGLAQDLAEARTWYQRAARKGSKPAQDWLRSHP